MNLLAIDTAGEALSVALEAGSTRHRLHRKPGLAHDEALVPAVEGLCRRAGLKLSDLDAVAVASGPGRFTGIRIGMAYAAVAAARLKVPALAVSRFAAIAFDAEERFVCAVVAGWRDEKFYQLFRRAKGAPMTPAGKPCWVPAASWARTRQSLEDRGAAIVEAVPPADSLIAPARYYLDAKKLPRFEPLYLKPAGYMIGKTFPKSRSVLRACAR